MLCLCGHARWQHEPWVAGGVNFGCPNGLGSKIGRCQCDGFSSAGTPVYSKDEEKALLIESEIRAYGVARVCACGHTDRNHRTAATRTTPAGSCQIKPCDCNSYSFARSKVEQWWGGPRGTREEVEQRRQREERNEEPKQKVSVTNDIAAVGKRKIDL
jgi:hypothetical protein